MCRIDRPGRQSPGNYLAAVGKVPIEEVARTIWPFYIGLFAVLLVVTYVPAVSLWIPSFLKF